MVSRISEPSTVCISVLQVNVERFLKSESWPVQKNGEPWNVGKLAASIVIKVGKPLFLGERSTGMSVSFANKYLLFILYL